MISLSSKVETGHRDIVHDAQVNYYGTRLATCSSDHLVKIFEIKPNGQSFPMQELPGHDGPVWQVAWAPPEFDSILASGSHDRKVIVWKEVNGKFVKTYEYSQHEASVNSVCWAPKEWGLVFACGSTDGSISVVEWCGDVWKPIKIAKAHEDGCNAVSWAPAKRSKALTDPHVHIDPKRIVSGGNDRMVKIWKEDSPDTWVLEVELEGHEDWVRDVAWAPSETYPTSTIASCGMDGRVFIWRTNSELSEKRWASRALRRYDEVLWHVSWSLCATVLAVSGSDNKVYLFQERLPNQWIQIADGEESSKQTT